VHAIWRVNTVYVCGPVVSTTVVADRAHILNCRLLGARIDDWTTGNWAASPPQMATAI
jgi:hypothetical protein